jgi:hypothetical protein
VRHVSTYASDEPSSYCDTNAPSDARLSTNAAVIDDDDDDDGDDELASAVRNSSTTFSTKYEIYAQK